MAKSHPTAVCAKISAKGRTVLPREVRQRLQVGPGDWLRYWIDEAGVHLEKAAASENVEPFATFTEWAGNADEEAYADL